MPQDRASGAAASRWRKQTARALAQRLGATKPVGNSNECRLDGKRVVIKCAAPATKSIGVTFQMLDRLDAVVGAFQRDGGAFELRSLTPGLFKRYMRDTASRGQSAGKVGIVERVTFPSQPYIAECLALGLPGVRPRRR
jgi:hypothetical protein